MGYEALADYYRGKETQEELPLGLGKITVADQLEIDFATAS